LSPFLTGSPATPTVCTQDATTLCLNNSRFAVSATWRTNDGMSGNGQAVRLTADTGYFTFFSATNVEAVVKVVDACGFNQKFWVFAGGLTNVNVVLTVRDTKNGTVKTYTNPANTAFQPIQDTGAFATCP
jgi:Zn-dependent alcohol dehydrogenase